MPILMMVPAAPCRRPLPVSTLLACGEECMSRAIGKGLLATASLAALLVVSSSGCGHLSPHEPPCADVPTESRKATLADYIISPPYVLVIDAVRLVPRPPYKIAPLDSLVIQVNVFGGKEEGKTEHLLPGQPIAGPYRVEPEGT